MLCCVILSNCIHPLIFAYSIFVCQLWYETHMVQFLFGHLIRVKLCCIRYFIALSNTLSLAEYCLTLCFVVSLFWPNMFPWIHFRLYLLCSTIMLSMCIYVCWKHFIPADFRIIYVLLWLLILVHFLLCFIRVNSFVVHFHSFLW